MAIREAPVKYKLCDKKYKRTVTLVIRRIFESPIKYVFPSFNSSSAMTETMIPAINPENAKTAVNP